VKYLGKSKQNITDTKDESNVFSDGFSDELPSSDGVIFRFDNEDIPNNPEVLSKIADIVKESSLKKNAPEESNNLLSTGKASFQASKIRGLTPPINGEKFDIKRSYQFRASTLKKLNELKGESNNINIYLNEIIDTAICFYYDSVFNHK
jgi:hypothetical protein